MGITGHDDDITDYSPDGVSRAHRGRARRAAGARRRHAGGRRRCRHARRDARTARCAGRAARRGTGRRRTQRDRLTAAIDARRVRSDGHRHRRRLGVGEPTVVAGARPGRGLRSGAARGSGFGASSRGPAGGPRDRAGGPDPAAVRRDGGELPRPATRRCMPSLQQRASAAADAYSRLAAVLREEIGPHARGEDAFGRDAYRLFSRLYLGADGGSRRDVRVGPATSWNPLWPNRSRLPNYSIPARRSPTRCAGWTRSRAIVVEGTDALQAWMQDLSDRVVDALADTHFEIAEPLRHLECRIAPTQTGGIYYTGPSEDLQQAGPDVVVGAAGQGRLPHVAARPPPSSTKACRAIICRSAVRSCWPTS